MPTKAEVDARNAEIAQAQARNAEIAAQRAKVEAQIAPLQTQLTGAKTVFDPLETKSTAIIDSQKGAMSKRGLNIITSAPYTTSFSTIQTVTPKIESLTQQLSGLQFVNVPSALKADSTSTSSTDILKAILKGMGFNSKIIDASTTFLESLITDGLDYDNAVTIFLNAKEYTTKSGNKMESPFYTEYGYLNEGLVNPKTAAELYNAVEGYKGIVDKYSLNQKFISSESLKAYVKNNVTVADLDERANTARLKAISADTGQVNALIKLGYISAPDQLTDFYLNPNIGKETLEQNRITGAFTAEAIRRANAGIEFNKERFTQYGAMLTSKGLSEAQAGQVAGQAFENIAEQLQPTTKLSGIYEGAQAATASTIQQELESEQLLGMASQRRKRVAAQEVGAFQAQPGTLIRNTGASGSLSATGVSGLL